MYNKSYQNVLQTANGQTVMHFYTLLQGEQKKRKKKNTQLIIEKSSKGWILYLSM